LTGTDFHAFAGNLGRGFVKAGSLVDIDRWDSEEELRRYQVGRSWRFVTVTELGTAKHLNKEELGSVFKKWSPLTGLLTFREHLRPSGVVVKMMNSFRRGAWCSLIRSNATEGTGCTPSPLSRLELELDEDIY
jgi:hypothetical protein